ncbi:MAG TPA: ferredoxin--nitrite reductase [Chloroflexota bacterium]|nr:ferredoxin--nitrite reductase [Chloroflexota bacterium]
MANKIEELKKAKHPLDSYPDILRYAAMGPEGWKAITDDDKERLKWFGVFFRKPTPGHFMMRIRIPNGFATSTQLRKLAAITRAYGRDVIDVTTRQQVQLRWMTIADVPDILDRLYRAGLTSRQTGMDNSRNVVGCPLAGLTADELFDASPVVQRYHEMLLQEREYADLPRKFNVAITGCLEHCTNTETQDIGLSPATKTADGQTVPGFNVRVGGKMGSGGMTLGQPLDAFVPVEEGAELCAQITLLFARNGPRETRSRARMAFLIEDWGIERFRSALERQMGRSLPTAGQDVRRRHKTDHLGITQQTGVGRYAVGLCIPVGRSNAAQFSELARLADTYGSGRVRFTIDQNVILVDIPDRALPDLLAEPLLQELRPDPSPVLRGTVSCIGVDYCNLALAETKGLAGQVIQHLEATTLSGVPAPATHGANGTHGAATDGTASNGHASVAALLSERPVTLNWSGCPAACGNHQAADIGFLGGKSRVNGQVIETFDIFVDGRTGADPRPGQKVLEKVPAPDVPAVTAQLVLAHAQGVPLAEAAARLAAAQPAELAPAP